jgi:hypothetical protein
MCNISKSLNRIQIRNFYRDIKNKFTAKGSILSQEIFCSDLNRSGNDSGTIKNINIKSKIATAVPK